MLELEDERYYDWPRDCSLALAPKTIALDVESDIVVHDQGLSRGYWWRVIPVGRVQYRYKAMSQSRLLIAYNLGLAK